MSAPTYAAHLLAEALEEGGFIEVVRMQPPDGMTVRDISGSLYTVMVYKQAPGPGPDGA